MENKELETLKYEELKEIATEKGIEFAGNIKKSDLIDLINGEIEQEEEENEEEENEEEENNEETPEQEQENQEENNEEQEIDIITLDNKPVSPIIKEEQEEVPTNFVPARKTAKNSKKVAKHLIHNGRVYKVLNNGRGMYADTGETFSLTELR